MQAFVSTGENVYRKPYTGSWDYMEKTCNGGVEIDMKESFFVGDAAGRPKDWIKGIVPYLHLLSRFFKQRVGSCLSK